MSTNQNISLRNQVAVVTGAGGGIGRAEALALSSRGASVVVNDIVAADADSVVADITRAGGAAVASYESVATPAGGAAIVQQAVEAFGALHVVVNNAGVQRPAYFGELTQDEIEVVIDTHLRAAFFVTQPAWRIMREQGYGRVVMTSSSSGMFGHHCAANYGAAKAGLYGLTKALAYEGLACNVKVNAILPFAPRTKMTVENPVPDWPRESEKFISPAAFGSAIVRNNVSLVAELVSYLASPQCEPTGEAFSTCCGRVARVFVGVGAGWLPDDVGEISADAIATHLTEIRSLETTTAPMWIFDEIAEVAARL